MFKKIVEMPEPELRTAVFQCAACGEWNQTSVDGPLARDKPMWKIARSAASPMCWRCDGTFLQVNTQSMLNWSKRNLFTRVFPGSWSFQLSIAHSFCS